MTTVSVITGINGFIGSHLKTDCEKRGWTVYGTTRADTATSTKELLEKVKPAYIFHTAAELLDESKMFETNLGLTHEILEYCRRASTEQGSLKRLIVFGSSSEYGRKLKPMSEKDVLEPETIYEGTKSAATLLTRSYSLTYNIPTTVIRPFTVYGRGEKSRKLIQTLLRLPEEITISQGVHDYVYITDFIAAVFQIIIRSNNIINPFEIVNIGTGKQTTNLEIVEIVERFTGHKFSVQAGPAKPYDSESWVCDTSHLSETYGITTPTTIEDGLKYLISDLYNGAHHRYFL